MSDLASIYQRVLDAVGERARPVRDAEALRNAGDSWAWERPPSIYEWIDHTDATNAIRCHWEDMLLEKGATIECVGGCYLVRFTASDPVSGGVVMRYKGTAPTLLEALAAAVIAECKP